MNAVFERPGQRKKPSRRICLNCKANGGHYIYLHKNDRGQLWCRHCKMTLANYED